MKKQQRQLPHSVMILTKSALLSKAKEKGKSGGARVITYVVTDNKKSIPSDIYHKSEFHNVDEKTLKAIIESLNADN